MTLVIRREDIFVDDDSFNEDAPSADFDPAYFPQHGLLMDDLNQVDRNCWETRYKFEISEFRGSYNFEVFLDWLRAIEYSFMTGNVS